MSHLPLGASAGRVGPRWLTEHGPNWIKRGHGLLQPGAQGSFALATAIWQAGIAVSGGAGSAIHVIDGPFSGAIVRPHEVEPANAPRPAFRARHREDIGGQLPVRAEVLKGNLVKDFILSRILILIW
jgi:hypothetical protein